MGIVNSFVLHEDAALTGRSSSPVSKRTRRFQLYAALILLDGLSVFFGFGLAGLLRKPHVAAPDGIHFGILIAPVYLAIALNSKAYGYQALSDWGGGARKAASSLIFSIVAVLFVAFYARASVEFSRVVFATGSLAAALALIGARFTFHLFVKAFFRGNLHAELVIVDNCEIPRFDGVRYIDAEASGLRPNLNDPDMLQRLGMTVRDADFVLVACAPQDRTAWSLLLKSTDAQGYVTAPEFDEIGAHSVSRYNELCVLQVTSGPLDFRSRAIKRTMDLALTIPAIIIFMPMLLLVALAIKLDSRGPILFRQQRMGQGNRLFSVFKFRSMVVDQCDPRGARNVTRQDMRVTRMGKLIRATSIDELPQLFNVLKGDMSLVGPRPHALGSLAGFELFWDIDERYWHRHTLKPGITGLAQVRGLRGATVERDDLVKRLQADLEYLNNWSIWRDIGILLSTVRVLVHANAY